jgi:small subunit ribosomal protein S3Ae
MFGEIQVAEAPATDPKQMAGRNVEVGAAELMGQPKPHMKLYFQIISLNGNRAFTRFNGFGVTKEYLFRVVRKRTSKLTIVSDVETSDKWKLQLTTLTILNRKAETTIRAKMRKYVEGFLREFAAKVTLDDFVKAIMEDAVQMHVKKFGSKIYPVRFNEITKIEVVKSGE